MTSSNQHNTQEKPLTIEKEIIKLGIRSVSQITFVRAEIQELEFHHILSFRRQVFINDEDKNKILESIFVEYENTLYKLIVNSIKISKFRKKTTITTTPNWNIDAIQKTASQIDKTKTTETTINQTINEKIATEIYKNAQVLIYPNLKKRTDILNGSNLLS